MKAHNGITLVLVMVVSVIAYGQAGTGELTGYIYTEDGAVISGAEVTATSPALINARTVTSNNRGYYRIINLPPGNYTLEVKKSDYNQKRIVNIGVRAGQAGALNITLTVGEFEETVTISQDAPLIDTTTPERQLNIDNEFIDRLPLSTTREWTGALSLVPSAVTNDEFLGGGVGGTFNSAGISIHGADGLENIFTMDGVSIVTNSSNNTALFTSSIIEDVEVVTSGYQASVSNGLGGYVNVVTKSGGNEFSGTAQLIAQPEAWNWENVDDEADESPAHEIYLPELSVGGPILKDRVWFFTSAMYDFRRSSLYMSSEQIQTYKDNGFGPEAFDYRDERDSLRYFGKVTASLSDNDKFVATYNWDRTENIQGYAAVAKEARSMEKTGGPFFSLHYSRSFTDNFFLSLHASYRSVDTGGFPPSGNPDDVRPAEYYYGKVNTYPWGTYGDYNTLTQAGGSGTASTREEEHYEYKGDADWFIDDFYGRHETRFGFQYFPERSFRIEYTMAEPFTSISYGRNAAGEWVPFSATFLQPDYPGSEFANSTGALYAQDSWSINDRLTLHIGLRAERNFDEVDLFRAVAYNPNAGLAYALDNNQNQVIRLSYSRKSEILSNTELRGSWNARISSGARYYYDYDLDGEWDDIFTNPITPVTYNNRDTLTVNRIPMMVDEDLGPSTGDYFQLGYTAVLPWNLTFDAAFIYNIFGNQVRPYRFYNLIWENNQPVAFRDPSREMIALYANDEWSSDHYRGVEFSLSRAFHDNWQMMASYAYQTTTRKGEWSPYEPERYYYPESWFEYTDSNQTPRHVLRIAASYVGPWGVMINGNLVYRSSTPSTALEYQSRYGIEGPATYTINGTTIQNPAFSWIMRNWAQPRSADRDNFTFLDSVTTLNLGIGKVFSFESFRFETQFQVFNIFNDNTPVTGFAYEMEEDLSGWAPGAIYYYDIQAPRAAQLLIKVIY